MRYWDSSALVPLFAAQAASPAVQAELGRDDGVVTWWATQVECVSALTRLVGEGRLEGHDLPAALDRLDATAGHWEEVNPTARVRRTAERLIRVHPLRAGDALQLAAAVVAADDDPATLPFVTLDEPLARAAEREGFPVVEPA